MPVIIDYLAIGPGKKEINKAFRDILAKKMIDGVFFGMRRAGGHLKREVQRAITSAGSSVGRPWKEPRNVDQSRGTPWWLTRKGHNLPLIEEGEYLNSWKVISNKAALFVAVNPGDPGEIHTGSGLPMDLLSQTHEFGFINARTGKRVPARPHVIPTAEANRELVRKQIDIEVRKATRQAGRILKIRRRLAKVRGRRR